MDKKTLLAVVLSAVVIIVGMILNTTVFAPDPVSEPIESETLITGEETNETIEPSVVTEPAETMLVQSIDDVDIPVQTFTEKTELYEISFTNVGAAITSIKLFDHLDDGKPLELIFSGDTGQNAFMMKFGDFDSNFITDTFDVNIVRHTNGILKEVIFSRDFLAKDGVPFSMEKRYVFQPDEYLFELRIGITNSVTDYPALNFNGTSYTLVAAPQIGPAFESLSNSRYGEERRYYTYEGDKRNEEKLKNLRAEYSQRLNWAAIAGKYFTLIGIPGSGEYTTLFSKEPLNGLSDTSQLAFERSEIRSSKQEDIFRFYFGPRSSSDLKIYNKADENGFGLSGLEIQEVVNSGGILGWLEWLLQKALFLFYMIIPNYGVAIILLTILVKLLLYPITHKSYESTSKMQAVNPKVQELREKLKDNPQKLNQEMAALYKREGVSPLGGCLPMLLQFPIFIALFQLLNKQFELRGAPFMLWINDLSVPDALISFGEKIPLLGWDSLNLLPILYVITQLLSAKIMQNPGASTNKNMKFMQYGLPLMFLFLLYNAPSGLFLYWTVTNILTVVQQVGITKYRNRKKDAE